MFNSAVEAQIAGIWVTELWGFEVKRRCSSPNAPLNHESCCSESMLVTTWQTPSSQMLYVHHSHDLTGSIVFLDAVHISHQWYVSLWLNEWALCPVIRRHPWWPELSLSWRDWGRGCFAALPRRKEKTNRDAEVKNKSPCWSNDKVEFISFYRAPDWG